MTREETIQKLNELKSLNLPKLSYSDLNLTDNYTPEQIKEIDEHMSAFAKIEDNNTCLWCGGKHGFSWGILHGSAYCNNCGFEFMVYHYIKDGEGKEFTRLTIPLQYHPDEFTIDEEE